MFVTVPEAQEVEELAHAEDYIVEEDVYGTYARPKGMRRATVVIASWLVFALFGADPAAQRTPAPTAPIPDDPSLVDVTRATIVTPPNLSVQERTADLVAANQDSANVVVFAIDPTEALRTVEPRPDTAPRPRTSIGPESCTTRAPMSKPALEARPQAREAAVKMTRPTSAHENPEWK